jgi:sulfite exporter TauE/SafE
MTGVEPLALLAACMAGLLGSGHCFAMCGGIAGSLGTFAGARPFASALQFNLGRLLSYVLLGSFFGGLLGLLGNTLDLQGWGKGLRVLTALLVAVIGLRMLTNWRGLALLERGGAVLWRKVQPLAVWAGRQPIPISRLLVGLCWGFLPCGLVYTVLFSAAASGSALGGGLTMLAFGLGTLPSMLALSLLAPSIASLLGDRDIKRAVGLALMLLAAWMLFTLFAGMSGGHAHH